MKKGKSEDEQQTEMGEESFGKLMSELFGIRGYKASAILSSDGELLFSNCAGKALDSHASWLGVLNKLFAHTCHLSETSGFMACDQMTMRTGEELVVIRSAGKDCLVGCRLVVLIDHNGNEAMVNMKLEKLLPSLMRCLTWDPDNLTRLYLKDLQGNLPDPALYQGQLNELFN